MVLVKCSLLKQLGRFKPFLFEIFGLRFKSHFALTPPPLSLPRTGAFKTSSLRVGSTINFQFAQTFKDTSAPLLKRPFTSTSLSTISLRVTSANIFHFAPLLKRPFGFAQGKFDH